MILQKQTEANILFEGEAQQSIGMSLDLDSAQVLMQMLSKNLYSDAIGSSIRETCSNALDSHRRAGVEKPIVVSFGIVNDNYEFSVEDFGLGLDDQDVENIISKYGKSTKRQSNIELGMFGLGFKAPLAYASTFYFVARKNGMERKYMMYEGEDTNTIDLLYEAPTTEANGVKVIIPVEYRDYYEFRNKINEQLAYFENVYFNIKDVNNEFKILRTEDYQMSELNQDRNMHICLDDVYYPLDFSKLGINYISFPVGLRFNLSDGLFPTPNRESIRYTEEAKRIILAKLEKVATQIIQKYNESISEKIDIKAVYNYYGSSYRYIKLLNSEYNITELSKYSNVQIAQPKVEGIDHISLSRVFNKLESYILQDYKVKFNLSNNRMSEAKHYYAQTVRLYDIFNKHVYLVKDFPKKLRDYTRDTLNLTSYSTRYFVAKSHELKLFPKEMNSAYKNYDNYYYMLGLDSVDRKLWRTHIKEFQMLREMIISYMIDYTDVTISQEWIDSKKRKVVKSTIVKDGIVDGKRIKLEGEIIGKVAKDLLRFVDGRNCKFETTTFKIQDLVKYKGLTVYTSHDNYMKLDNIYEIAKRNNIQLVTFSQRELVAVDKLELHNLISFEKFMEGKTKPFKRIVTSYLINKVYRQHGYAFNRRTDLSKISNSLSEKLKTLEQYKMKYYESYVPDTVYSAMVDIANEHNLFDELIYSEYKEIKEFLDKFEFINEICKKMSYDDTIMLNVIRDLLKYNKQRIDYTNYNIILNEDVAEELVEESIEELI